MNFSEYLGSQHLDQEQHPQNSLTCSLAITIHPQDTPFQHQISQISLPAFELYVSGT